MSKEVYVGWIYGNKGDAQALRDLGVGGRMSWKRGDNSRSITSATHGKHGVFEHRECSDAVLDLLEELYPSFWRGAFTLLDEEGYNTYRDEIKKRGGIPDDMPAVVSGIVVALAAMFFPAILGLLGAIFTRESDCLAIGIAVNTLWILVCAVGNL